MLLLLLGVIVIFVFIITLSGGRQAFGTILISGALYILWYKSRIGFGTKIGALIMISLVFYVSLWTVSTYFPEFSFFAAEKRSRLGSDFINHRILNTLWYPLLEFNLGEFLVFGDGYTNKHNVITTVLHIRERYATPNKQRLRLGLPGYLIRFAPRAFIPDRQTRSR